MSGGVCVHLIVYEYHLKFGVFTVDKRCAAARDNGVLFGFFDCDTFGVKGVYEYINTLINLETLFTDFY